MTRIDENPYKKTVRRRTIPTGFRPFGVGVRYDGNFKNPIKYTNTGPELCEAQVTESEGHPYWSDIKDLSGHKPDMGGDFVTTRWTPEVDRTIRSASYVDFSTTPPYRLWQHAGHRIENISTYMNGAGASWGYITNSVNFTDLQTRFPALSESDSTLLARGTTAIARTRPDVSPVSLTQFLVELKRDGLPFIAKLNKAEFERILNAFESRGVKNPSKKASDYFLENQFGLKPFISDLTDFSRMAKSGISTLDNLQKNSGKLIRRRYSFPHEQFSSVTSLGSANPAFGFNPLGSTYVVGYSQGNTAVETSRKTWFSGAYRIYMPTDQEPVSRLKALADKLRWDYGLDLDFATLWNLAPWSWLLDWNVNLGDVITNVAKFQSDAVVLHYGYVMQETVTTYTTHPRGFIKEALPVGNLGFVTLKVTKKRRLRATPYGFGKTFGSLSGTQKAILAAIGITRF